LTAGHPESAHQGISHLRGEAVANRWAATNMRIEHAIDLLLRQSLGLENIDQGLESDAAPRLINDRDDPGAGWANTAD
jgi:hypothetical protein